jgi:hypothetical protein
MRTRRARIATICTVLVAAALLSTCSHAPAPSSNSPDTANSPDIAKERPAQPSIDGPTTPPPPKKPLVRFRATPTGGENPPPSDDELIEGSLNRLKKGNLAYSTPAKMKMGRTERVTARIGSSDVSIEALKSGLPSGQEKTVAVASTPVSARMKMELKSADFNITPLSSEEQGVGGDTPTAWEWDIAPKHSGKLSLHLAAVVELKNLSRDFTSIDRDVAVQVDPVGAVESFMEGNWQWLIATLTAIGGAVWKFLKGRKTPGGPDQKAAGTSTGSA